MRLNSKCKRPHCFHCWRYENDHRRREARINPQKHNKHMTSRLPVLRGVRKGKVGINAGGGGSKARLTGSECFICYATIVEIYLVFISPYLQSLYNS